MPPTMMKAGKPLAARGHELILVQRCVELATCMNAPYVGQVENLWPSI